ncbi:MAG: XRE family transcriptional regulator [Pedobacter sp.]|nr:MAG: XRE family transcriptional regulator [Pedobacter sp.]
MYDCPSAIDDSSNDGHDDSHQSSNSIPAYSKLETDITDPNFSRINQIAEVHSISFRDLLDIGEESTNEQAQLVDALKGRITELEASVIRLQGKLIEMYDTESQRNKA